MNKNLTPKQKKLVRKFVRLLFNNLNEINYTNLIKFLTSNEINYILCTVFLKIELHILHNIFENISVSEIANLLINFYETEYQKKYPKFNEMYEIINLKNL
jgi:hypothetical protein